MRDFDAIVDDLYRAGLISDNFREKLASEVACLIGEKIKLANVPEAAPGMLSTLWRGLTHPTTLAAGVTAGAGLAGHYLSRAKPLTGMQRAMQSLEYAAPHLAIAGALGGASMMKNVLTKAMDNMSMNSSYSQMMQQQPDLQKADPKVVQRTFDVVRQYAPSVAKNPTVAGTFVKGILQFPDAAVTPEHVRSLVDVERTMSGLNEPGMLDAFGDSVAHSAGQSMVNAFDPMKQKELHMKEEEHARRRSMHGMEQMQGISGITSNILKGLQTHQQMGEPGFYEQQAAKERGQKDHTFYQEGLRGAQKAQENEQRERHFDEQHQQREQHHADKMKEPGMPSMSFKDLDEFSQMSPQEQQIMMMQMMRSGRMATGHGARMK